MAQAPAIILFQIENGKFIKKTKYIKFRVHFWYKTIKRTFLSLYLSFSFIEPYRIYRFNPHLSNHFCRASINQFLFIDRNDKGHLSVSAGVWLWYDSADIVMINKYEIST